MNETSYNMAIFAKEYLDKTINGIQTLAPHVWDYLQWKCWIDAISYLVIITLSIVIGIGSYKWLMRYRGKKLAEDKYYSFDNNDIDVTIHVVTVTLIVISLIILFTQLYLIGDFIISLTPICPIDKAIEIGTNLIGK